MQDPVGGHAGHTVPQSAREAARRPREAPARSRTPPSAVRASSADAPPHRVPAREAAVPPPRPFGGQTAASAVQARGLPVRRERTVRSPQSTPREANRANGPSADARAESVRPVHAAQQSSSASTDGTSRRSNRSCSCVSPPCRHRSPRGSQPKLPQKPLLKKGTPTATAGVPSSLAPTEPRPSSWLPRRPRPPRRSRRPSGCCPCR